MIELADAVNVKVGAEAYTVLPEKRAWVHQAGPATSSTPSTTCPRARRSTTSASGTPPTGGGVIGSDTIAVMRGAEKPVLAHTFINYLLDEAHSLDNYGWLGYQPPQNAIDPDSRRRRRVRPRPPRLRGDPARGLRHRLPAAPAVARRREDLGQRLVEVHRRGELSAVTLELAPVPGLWPTISATKRRSGAVAPRLLAAPGVLWLSLLFVVPFYGVLAVAFGRLDPIFGNAVPVWNPLEWDITPFGEVLDRVFAAELGEVFLRTFVYVGLALAICFLIGYPVAYYVARKAGPPARAAARPAPGAVLDQLPDADAGVGQPAPGGRLRQRRPAALGHRPGQLARRAGGHGRARPRVRLRPVPHPAAVRRPRPHRPARARGVARPRHGSGAHVLRVTLPMSRQGMLAAAVITALPMMGDYYTADLLSGSPRTSMVGNQIEFYLFEGSQKNAGASLVVILSVLLMVAMAYYLVRPTGRRGSCGDEAASSAWWGDPWRRPVVLADVTWLYIVWSIVPVLIAIQFSFNSGRSRSTWQGFSMRWWWGDPDRSLWHDHSLRQAMFNSLTLAGLTMLIATPLGVALALGLARWRGPVARGSNLLMLVPLSTPEIVMGAMLFLVFDNLYTAIPLGRAGDAARPHHVLGVLRRRRSCAAAC